MSGTPQPMSDAEIRRLSDEADIEWGKAVGGPMPYELFARAILAARDAQWVAMLGEPVAELWQHSETGRTRIVTPDMIVTADASWLICSPLYAIKETP